MENMNNILTQFLAGQVGGGLTSPTTGAFSANSGNLFSAGSLGEFASLLLGLTGQQDFSQVTDEQLKNALASVSPAAGSDSEKFASLLGNLVNDQNKNLALQDLLTQTTNNVAETVSVVSETPAPITNNVLDNAANNLAVNTTEATNTNNILVPNNIAINNNAILNGDALALDAQKEISGISQVTLISDDVKTGEELSAELLASGLFSQGIIGQTSLAETVSLAPTDVLEQATAQTPINNLALLAKNAKGENLANLKDAPLQKDNNVLTLVTKPEITNISSEDFVASKNEPTLLNISAAADDTKLKLENTTVTDLKLNDTKTFAGGIQVKNDGAANQDGQNNSNAQQHFNLNQPAVKAVDKKAEKTEAVFMADSTDSEQPASAKTDSTLTSTSLTTSDVRRTSETTHEFASRLHHISKYVHASIDEVGFKVIDGIKEGSSKILIQLEPADLGRLDIRVDMNSDGKINMTILADKSETLDLLQKDVRNLEKTLQDAGFKGDFSSMNFNLRDGNGGWRQHANQNMNQENGDFNLDEENLGEIAAIASSSSAAGASNKVLDIRV